MHKAFNYFFGGFSRINLNCFCTFLVLLCVFAYTIGKLCSGLMPPPTPLLTTLIRDLTGTWLGPTHLCFFPNKINKNSMLKEVQTWGMFLRKLGLPEKRDIIMYNRPFLRYCQCLNHSNLMLSKCTRVCFGKVHQ